MKQFLLSIGVWILVTWAFWKSRVNLVTPVQKLIIVGAWILVTYALWNINFGPIPEQPVEEEA